MDSNKSQESKNPKPVIYPGWTSRYDVVDTNKKKLIPVKLVIVRALFVIPNDILN